MKYKKLDNLDDLRAGDVIFSTIGNEFKVIKVDGLIIYHEFYDEIRMATVGLITKRGWTAKRPLPEKKEKEWGVKRFGYFYSPEICQKKMYQQNIWMDTPEQKLMSERGLIFKSAKQAKEAALKMLKALE